MSVAEEQGHAGSGTGRAGRGAEGRPRSLARRALRIGALAGGAFAVVHWPASGYGTIFWLWVSGALGYIVSFTPAIRRRKSAPALVRLTVLLLLAGAVALRLPDIESIPGNISVDEVLPGMQARAIAAGEAGNVFSTLGWFDLPNLTFAFPALVMQLLPGDPLFALRFSSFLTGLLGIAATFLLGRRMFGDGVAVTATFFMVASFWHIHNSRTGFPFVQSSCAIPLILYLLVRARQDLSDRCMALCGTLLGLALQLYFPVRALLVLVPLFLVAHWWHERERALRAVRDVAILGGGTALALAPLLVSVSWDSLLGRSRSVLLTNPAKVAELSRTYGVDGFLPVLWRNVREAAGMFTNWADVCVLNRSPDGLLDDVTLVAVVVGSLASLFFGRGWSLVVLLWAAFVFFFGAALTDAPRASYRLAPAMPALFFLAAGGVRAVLPGADVPARWYRLLVWPITFAVLGGLVVQQNHRRFFVKYASEGHGHDVSGSTAMRLARDHCDGRMFYILAYPEPLGRETTFGFFCAQHVALRERRIPGAVHVGQPATFLVMPWRRAALGRLKRCYPEGRVTTYRRSDGAELLTRVDVGVEALERGREICSTEGRKKRGPLPMDRT